MLQKTPKYIKQASLGNLHVYSWQKPSLRWPQPSSPIEIQLHEICPVENHNGFRNMLYIYNAYIDMQGNQRLHMQGYRGTARNLHPP
jgi:hypothetical protein